MGDGTRSTGKKILIGFGVLAVAMQFFRPGRENPTTDPALAAPSHLRMSARIEEMLRTSCYNCHSNESRWPWYSHVAPASWLVARDVNQGRRHLNFSLWGGYTPARRVSLLGTIADQVSGGEMPYPPYLLLHGEAKLTPEQRDSLVDWAAEEQDRLFTHGGEDEAEGGK